METSFAPPEFARLLHLLSQPTALVELGLLSGCLAAAWLVARLLRGRSESPSAILFGGQVYDGALFPLLALGLAYAAQHLLPDEIPPAVFRIALPILISLALIRLTVRVLRLAFPASQLMRLFERSLSWIAWLAVVLWVTGLLPALLAELDRFRWTMGGSQVSLRNLLEGAINVVIVMVLALWVSAALESRLLKGPAANLSTRKMAANALRALLLFIGLMFALSAAGIDLTALGVLGGAIGVGIGLGLQKLAANYVSGFVILAERSLRIGDLVKVDGFEGRIVDINTRATLIRAANGRESIVPNEMLTTQRVENASLTDPLVLLNTVVQVAYGTDVPALRERLTAAIVTVPRVLAEPGPAVHLQAFAADGLELNIVWWINDPHNGLGNVRSAVNETVLATLDAAGVEIPFPQRVLRGAEAAPLGLRRAGGESGGADRGG